MTISEIAKMAGVSSAAVSRYLNNGYLSEEKREAIKRVIDKTGYKPSIQAQTLRTKKTKLIGVIIPKIDSSSIGRVVAGISSVLEEKGYQLLLASTQNNPDKELEYLDVFDDSRVDGVIFIASVITAKHKKILKNSKVPIVVVGQSVPGSSCVYHDDYNAMRELTELMIQRGRKSLGYIGAFLQDEAVGKERFRGYSDALIEAERQMQIDDNVIADFSMESGYEKAKELLEKNPKIDGIICATDTMAAGALMYLKEIGKDIPKEIEVMGVGDSVVSKISDPKFATVHYYYEESGIKASEIMMEMLAKGKATIDSIKMGYSIVEN